MLAVRRFPEDHLQQLETVESAFLNGWLLAKLNFGGLVPVLLAEGVESLFFPSLINLLMTLLIESEFAIFIATCFSRIP